MTVGDIRCNAIKQFKNNKIETAELDVDLIIARYLYVEPNRIVLHNKQNVPLLTRMFIEHSFKRRLAHEPIAYILGYKYFYRDKFIVSPKCLIPRPDTEHLIYTAESLGKDFKTILDIGTGSGAVAISLARVFPKTQITATDINIRSARKNIRRLKIRNIELLKHDILGGKALPRKYDLIISNPPYLSASDMQKLPPNVVNYEPTGALFGGVDGFDFYRRIADVASRQLCDNGVLIFETDYKWQAVTEIIEQTGLNVDEVIKDYSGLERVIVAHK